MGRVVSFFQPLDGDVGIDLRRHEMGVAEEFLDAAEVGAAIEKMRGVTVAEFVGREFRIESGAREVTLEAGLNDTRLNRSRRAGGGPEDRFVAGRNFAERFPIMMDRLEGVIADRRDAFLFAFAANADEALGSVEIFNAQAAEFADAETAGINRFENGGVAEVNRAIDVFAFLLRGFALFGEFEDRRVEQRVHLLCGEEAGEAAFEFGELDVFNRRSGDNAATDEKLVERTQRGKAKADGSASELLATKITEIGTEIIALERGPRRRGRTILLMPAGEFFESLPVIALRVRAGGTIGGEVGEERLRVGVEFWSGGLRWRLAGEHALKVAD